MPAGVPADAARGAHDTLAGALTAAQRLPDRVGQALSAAAKAAFTDGMHVAAVISAVVLAAVAVMVLRALRDLPPIGAATPGEPGLRSDPRAHGPEPTDTYIEKEYSDI